MNSGGRYDMERESLTIVSQFSLGTSWARVAKSISKAMKLHGVDTELVDLANPKAMSRPVIFMPLQYTLGQSPYLLKLYLSSGVLGAGYLSIDSTGLGYLTKYLIDIVDLVMIPFNLTSEPFLDVSLELHKFEVCHLCVSDSIAEYLYRDRNECELVPRSCRDKIKILLVAEHDLARKNADVALRALLTIYGMFKDRVCVFLKLDSNVSSSIVTPSEYVSINRFLSSDDWFSLLSCMDIVLAPSGGGSCELVALEALTLGKIVIATNWPSFREYLPFYVPISNVYPEPVAGLSASMCLTGGHIYRVTEKELVETLKLVIEDIDKFYSEAKKHSEKLARNAICSNIVKKEWIPTLEKHGFI